MEDSMFIRLGRAGLLAGLLTIPTAAFGALMIASTPRHTPAGPPAVEHASGPPALTELSDAFSAVAERIKPSVVYVTSKRPGAAEDVSFDVPPEFRRFFGMPDSPEGNRPGRRPLMTASGSGFVVSSDGYILTNDHVVDGATQVRVRLLDRREVPAKVVGTDPTTDVAVLKIDASGLQPAPLGSSEATRVGEWVLAIGNPFGENLTFTVTQGIVSAKGRALDLPNRSTRSIQDFIQTDAAINPGNSGGPLVNTSGEVIGINSAIVSETGSYSGYGFAIPIDLARQVMDQLIKSGKVERVALGILARNATPEDAAYAGLDRIEGVLVEDFNPHSPAEAAGLRAGDLIVAIDGQPIDYVAQVQERVAFKHPGDRVAVEVARKDGKRAVVNVTLAAAPTEVARASSSGPEASDQSGGNAVPALGASFRTVTDEMANELNLPDGIHGVVATSVDDSGPLDGHLVDASQGPDVIQSVEGKPVRNVVELRQVVDGFHAGEIVTLQIWNAQSRHARVERVRLQQPG
jgi:serine protease Do